MKLNESRQQLNKKSEGFSFAFYFLLVFWLLLGFLDLLKSYVIAVNFGRDFTWLESLKFVACYSGAWIVLSLPIFQFFQKTRSWSWFGRLGVQVPASFLFASMHVALLSLAYSYLVFIQSPPTVSFVDFYIARMGSRFFPAALNSIFAYWVVIFILLAFNYYEEYRKQALYSLQLQAQLSEAHLQTLRMQVQPHFLFNAHNTVSMLVRTGRYAEATNMLAGLSELLRTTLTRDHDQLVSVAEEMRLVRQYLKIENARFPDRLKTEVTVEPAVETALVPNLILQPLVENAFKHGISRSLGDAKLAVSAKGRNQHLEITVYNSGPPLHENWNVQSDSGIGLANVRGRLRQLYSDNFQFSIENAANGVMTTIGIPFQTGSR